MNAPAADTARSAAPGLPALGTVAHVAAAVGGEVVGRADLGLTGFGGLEDTGPGGLTFIRSAAFAAKWPASKAAAAIVSRGLSVPGHDPETRALIVVPDADAAVNGLLAAAAAAMAPEAPPPGVHPTAAVDPAAEIHASASVGPLVVVAAGARVGPGAVLHARCVVAAGASVGERASVHSGAYIGPRVRLGPRTAVLENAVLGAEGFGFLRGKDGVNARVPHLGSVVVGADCEIGALTAIDRGKLADTTLGDGVKIDNLVQIGHSCLVGDHTVICGGTSIGGSTVIGAYVTIGGAVAMRDNIRVADRAMIGGASQVGSDVDADEPWFGVPARPGSEAKRAYAALTTLPRLRQRVAQLAKRLASLEGDRRNPGGPA